MSHVLERYPGLELIQFGIRNYQSLPSGEVEQVVRYLSSHSECYTDFDVNEGSALQAFKEKIGSDREIYLTMDVDGLPSHLVEATGYPAAHGVQFERLLEIVQTVVKNHRLVGIDLMEYGTSQKTKSPSAELCVLLILKIIEGLSR